MKTGDIAKQSPLDLKPMMVLVEDKQKDIKQRGIGVARTGLPLNVMLSRSTSALPDGITSAVGTGNPQVRFPPL